MGNHVHLMAVPEHREGLARAIGLCHQRYASPPAARRLQRSLLNSLSRKQEQA